MSRRDFMKLAAVGAVTALFPTACEAMESEQPAAWMPPVIQPYWPIFRREADKYSTIPSVNLSHLAASVALVESGFDKQAVSRAGASGLMQIMPGTAAEIARKLGIGWYDVFDPDTNITMGVYYLDWELGRNNGDIWNALCGYYGSCGNSYPDQVSELYNDRNSSNSARYDRWLRAMINSGGLHLRTAFEQQGKSYDAYVAQYLGGPTQAVADNNSGEGAGVTYAGQGITNYDQSCTTVTAPGGLPRLIHPGERIGNQTVQPGNTAYGMWQAQGSPSQIEYCGK